MPRWSRACVLLVGLLPGIAAAQSPSDPADTQERQPAPFRSGTNLVRVDVSVMDKDGNPVRTLTADDFELRENGALQAISSFKLVDANGQPTDDLSLPIRSREHAATEAARDDVRVFLIFWDEYHIDQFGSAVRAREQLTRFVLEAFGPTDLVGVMDPLTPISALRFTRDRRALAEQIRLLRGRRGIYVPARSAVEEAHLREAQDVERIRSQVTASALKSAIAHLGAIRQGRKAVVFLSEGLIRLGQDGVRVFSDLIRTANDNNTAIYTVDPRGLQAGGGGMMGGMASMLAALADSTGAEPIISNDMTVALRKIVRHASAFYLLGYTPRNGQLDGKFREIKVRVRQSGVEVRARNGYWAPRGADVERARAVAAAAARPSPVTSALHQLEPDNSRRAADLWIGLTPVPDRTAVALQVAWTARPGFENHPEAAAVSLAATADERVIFNGRVGEEGVVFEAPAGEVQLDFSIHDSTGEVIDRDQREFTVPSVDDTTLALSTPVVLRARSPAEFRLLAENRDPAPFAGREFSRTDRVLFRVRPYGSASSTAAVTAQLLGRRGNTLAELPIRSAAGGGYVVDLPLSNLASGEFVVAIAARTAADSVETYVPLRVGR